MRNTAHLQNLAIERAVLGSLVGDTSGVLLPQLGGLQPEHFAEHLHARLFEAMTKLWSEGKAVSPMVLATYFASDDTLIEIGIEYLTKLVAHAAPPISLRSHGDLLQDLAARRRAVVAADELTASAQLVTVGESFRPALAAHIEAVQSLFDRGSSRKTTYTAAEAGAALVERLDFMLSGQVDSNAVRTNIPALDDATGGLRRGDYAVVGGRPGMGKTAFAVQLTSNVLKDGGGVFYASLEMPVAQIMPRLVSCHLWTPGGTTNVPYSRILRLDLKDSEARWVASAAQEMNSFPLIIDDAPGLSPAELEARAQVAKARLERSGYSLKVVVVDHLHKMRQLGLPNNASQYTEISARLAEMAKRLDCAVMALAQLSRGVEARDDKRPQLADLRESGSIEQDADLVMFAYRPAYYLDGKPRANPAQEAERLRDLETVKNKLEIMIEKQRSGPVGTVKLWCDMAHNVVIDPSVPNSREVAA